MRKLDELREYVEDMSTAPTMRDMPRRSLADKGILGPTGAHVIEEIHTPLNFAYLSITTGTTAFQNLVGVTHPELADRVTASVKALTLAGVSPGERILFTYPPLVNVFPKQALEEYGANWFFLKASSRDALLLALCEERPRVVVGESTFLRAALQDAAKLNLLDQIPRDMIWIAVGTPLDLDLPDTAERLVGGRVHDLYGCQEFGWLTLNGIPLREDISLIPCADGEHFDFIVGGLPTGDRFPVLESGHICNRAGKILTYSGTRSEPDWETEVLATTAAGTATISRLARSILRIKAKIVRVSSLVEVGAESTVLALRRYGDSAPPVLLEGSEKTRLFDTLLQAQMDYQSNSKTDPAWNKQR